MDLSIVVTHYKNPEVLKMSLRHLEKAQKKLGEHDIESEIIVSDSDTVQKTRDLMADAFYDIAFLESEKNIGFGKAANRGVEKARGNFVFIMNADVVVAKPKTLAALMSHLHKNSDVGIVGPQLRNFDETFQPSAFRFYTPATILLRRTYLGKTKRGKKHIERFMLADNKELTQKPTEVDWLMGSALMTKKEYLEQADGFDERFFMYMEDVDLCRRFQTQGLKVVYQPEAVAYHFHGASSRSQNVFFSLFNKYTRIHVISALKYFRKHGFRQKNAL